MTFNAIDSQSIKTSWKEGIALDRDLDFEKDITFYKIKDILEFPCKTVNFIFNIKSSLEIYSFNVKRFLPCFLKFYDEEIKEYLSDVLLEGIINILKSGYSNPVSTFFSNILIIEGPSKLKSELFGALYKYVEETAEFNQTFKTLIDVLIKITFNPEIYKEDKQKFLNQKSTTISFFFYNILTIYLENNDIYLSAYDFIQPDSNMISNPASLDPEYISKNFNQALAKDLTRFKTIRDQYEVSDASTIYHKAYHNYVTKNIEILCSFIYHKPNC